MPIFNKDRIPFVVYNKKPMLFVVDHETKSCKELALKHGLSIEEYENSLRGYILPGRLQFFTGNDYRPYRGPLWFETLYGLYEAHKKFFKDAGAPIIYNGVIKGEEGEQWPPMEEMSGIAL